MNGFLHKTPDGGITCTLTDKWGYVHVLTGIPAEDGGRKGYAVEVKLVGIPDWFALPGDDFGET